jgi:hypothetical protein
VARRRFHFDCASTGECLREPLSAAKVTR